MAQGHRRGLGSWLGGTAVGKGRGLHGNGVQAMTDPEELARQMREWAEEQPEREPEPTEPLVVIRQVYQPTEDQKKLYFNAGRWAGGARDWTARKAFEQLAQLGEM